MPTTVSEINIYPVKSLGGISLPASEVTTRGLKYDRRFMLVDDHHEFLTQREHPLMATIRCAINGDALMFTSALGDSVSVPLTPTPLPTRTVTVWSSHVHAHTVDAAADEFFSDYLGMDARLVYMPESAERRVNPEYAKNGEIVSFADGYPLLIASEESLADLNARIIANGGKPVTMNRFRPNVVVQGCAAFAEDSLGNFTIGSAAFRGAKPCTRCQVTTTDQRTGEILGPEPLRTLATFRDSPSGARFGMNLLVTRTGALRVGDSVGD